MACFSAACIAVADDEAASSGGVGWGKSLSAVARIEGRPQAVIWANHRRGSAVKLSAKPCVVSR